MESAVVPIGMFLGETMLSKVQQKEAADRILKKFPLAPEEQNTARLVKLDPDDYVRPKDGVRTCGVCGAMFEDGAESAMQKMADHSATHNPSPNQWSEASRKIRSFKKESTQAQNT